jgi:hypothetical protein
MQNLPDHSPIRALLFPHSGEEPLSPRQGWRIIIVWAMVFTSPMVLITLLVIIFAATPLYKAVIILLSVLVGGLLIFGLSAWAIVSSFNRVARLRQVQQNKGQ